MLKYISIILKGLFFLFMFLVNSFAFCQTKHVILISIDGLHPDMYLNNSWPAANLRQLMKTGTYADHCLSVFPAYTYPAHTAMLTGALPARSKVAFNQPIGSQGEWNWYSNAIKVNTLWDAAHNQPLTTAAIMWPGTVGAQFDINISEIWDADRPDDRATLVRKNANPKGIYEEIESNATGKLDQSNMNDNYLSLDENTGRMAAYIFKKYTPNIMVVHLACVDGMEHAFGRDNDSVRLALETNDRAVGNIMEAVKSSTVEKSTAIIIVGDHGFSTINTLFRPNILLEGIDANFVAAGGSAFLYPTKPLANDEKALVINKVISRLNSLLPQKRKLFKILQRNELDKIGADSTALMALTGTPGLIFSGSRTAASTINTGPGTLFQNYKYDGLFVPVNGGHHGYDPREPDMWTGFIAYGAGIKKRGHIPEMRVVDIAPLIAKLLNIDFPTPDGKLVQGILNE